MGIPLVAIAKLNLLLLSHRNSTIPFITCLILPFLIKLSFGYRRVRGTYSDFVYTSRLFFFQLQQIAARTDQPADVELLGGESRWQRAIRLVYGRLREATRSPVAIDVEDSLHTLSMLAL